MKAFGSIIGVCAGFLAVGSSLATVQTVPGRTVESRSTTKFVAVRHWS